jgi:hypothetical protein
MMSFVSMPFVFELITMLAMLALGFVLGRIWEIRQQMIKKREHEEADFRRIPTAHLPAEQNF